MRYKPTLTPEDRERIRSWVSQKQWVDLEGNEVAPSGEPESYLLDLLENWSDVVVHIERGYNLTIYDYENDIMWRDEIDEVMQLLTDSGRKAYAELVAPMDERFVRATIEVPVPISYPVFEPRERFWWYRVPKQAGEELTEWLKAFLDNR